MANNENFDRLINEEIDGTITAADLKVLKKMLVDSEEARRYYDQLRKAANVYHLTKDLEPPPDLKGNVMRSIDPGRYAPSGRSTIFEAARSYVYGIKAGYALSFGGGVLVGAIILAIGIGIFDSPGDLNENHLTGTILSENRAGDFRILKAESFSRDPITGKIELAQSGNIIRARLFVNGTLPVIISIKYDHNYVKLMELYNTPHGLGEIEIGNDRIIMKNYNDGEYDIIFEKLTGGKSFLDFQLESDTVIYVSSLAID